MYDGTVVIGELWVEHPTLLGIRSAKLVVAFGSDGLELWSAGVLRVHALKRTVSRNENKAGCSAAPSHHRTDRRRSARR